MKILLIGSGGREHALARTLVKTNSGVELFCASGNPGILNYAQKANLNISDFNDIIRFCRQEIIELVIPGPEQPLAEGIADELIDAGILVFGPVKGAALLESSKAFAKEFMREFNIPTAAYGNFSKEKPDSAHKFIEEKKKPVVLKASGLAAGKGVIIPESRVEAHVKLDEIFEGKFGDAGDNVVIEEFMEGEEASVLAVCDGDSFVTLIPSQDYKRAYSGDRGPNTGGMGAYAPAPIVDDALLAKVEKLILYPAIEGMKKRGTPFTGCLYAGLMIKGREPKVVEFNVRFGDPETQAVLTLFDGDFAGLLHSAAKGNLDKNKCSFMSGAFATTVILASEGYPDKYGKGFTITGIEQAEEAGAIVYHAGTREENGKIISSGGRVLAVTGVGDSIKESISNAYQYCGMIDFENKYNRKDIGYRAVEL